MPEPWDQTGHRHCPWPHEAHVLAGTPFKSEHSPRLPRNARRRFLPRTQMQQELRLRVVGPLGASYGVGAGAGLREAS